MNRKTIYMIGLILIIVLITVIGFSINNIIANKILQVNENIDDNKLKDINESVKSDKYVIQKLTEKGDNYDIEIYYPVTKYEDLNNQILNQIQGAKKSFLDKIKTNDSNNKEVSYYFNINFNFYEYLDYSSYAFHIDEFSGYLHPNTYIFTINYDTKNKKLITIDDLILKNKSILFELSDYTYTSLSNNEVIKNINNDSIVKEGTSAQNINFNAFVFSSDGLKVFFQRYQVAPYVAGEFVVDVPYDKISIKF